jgi:hypothetical protein
MKKTWGNYKKPVPPFWRKVGDFILVISVFLSGSVMSLPISEHYKLWTIFVLNFISTTLKFWANTKKEEETFLINRDLSAGSDPSN